MEQRLWREIQSPDYPESTIHTTAKATKADKSRPKTKTSPTKRTHTSQEETSATQMTYLTECKLKEPNKSLERTDGLEHFDITMRTERLKRLPC